MCDLSCHNKTEVLWCIRR